MISIIVPTYNEKNNIPELLVRTDQVLSDSVPYEMVLVDDNSPDRTADIALEFSDVYPLNVIRRTDKNGVSSAILDGIEEAQYEILVIMDADLQHPPERIPDLVRELQNGADICVGSRYSKGGSAESVGWIRSGISRAANSIAQVLLDDFSEVNDLLSGFFAFRREVLNGVELDPVGYKILLSILAKGNYTNVNEVGYRFQERKSGKSKLGFRNIWDFTKHLTSLYQ